MLGYPAGSGCRIRSRNGKRAGGISPSLRCRFSRGLHGRTTGATSERDTHATAGGTWKTQTLAFAAGASQRDPKGHYDNEYERNGTASIFMFCEPKAGKRNVSAHEKCTMTDWAQQIKHLLDVQYPNAKKVVLVCDSLNTHKPAALYKTFPPEQARCLLNRLEIHYTPKHGSWLNIAEIELATLTRQCLDRRIPDLPTLQAELNAWNKQRNNLHSTINWQFTTTLRKNQTKTLVSGY